MTKDEEMGEIKTVKVYNQAYVDKQEKRITELEKEISVLLSCNNCSENKGGLFCEKEFENKCLTQKIEFIKELEKENAELRDYNEKLLQSDIDKHNKIVLLSQKVNVLQKKNAELKEIEIDPPIAWCEIPKFEEEAKSWWIKEND